MIKFSNGRNIDKFLASGSLAFDGKGWLWDWPLIRLDLIKRELFGIVLKSLTFEPRRGNLCWWKPWECVRIIKGGAVNKVGLTNPGFYWWLCKVAPHLRFNDFDFIVSLHGEPRHVIHMASQLNDFHLAAIELNPSCPNTGYGKPTTEDIVHTAMGTEEVSRHPLILKLSADQDCVEIARRLVGVIEAISFNTLAWEKVFPGKRSPLHRLQKRVGGGGGGVSGKPLQRFNWPVMHEIHLAVSEMPLIASSIMEYEDIGRAREFGASAVSFGTLHLPDANWKFWQLFTNPCRPTRFVEMEKAQQVQGLILDNNHNN